MALIKSKQLDLSNDFAFTGGVSLTTAPTSGNDVVNKTYVDSLSTASSAGLDFKESVRVATTQSLSITYSSGVLTATSNGALTVDGVSVTAGASEALSMRVLVKDQANSADNGIYYCSQTGDASNPFTLTRATDADSDSDINTGCFVFVEDGTANQNKAFVLQANNDGTSPQLGTDDLNFIQFSGAGQISTGTGLAKSGDQINLSLDDITTLSSGAFSAGSTAPDHFVVVDASDSGAEKKLSLYDFLYWVFRGSLENKGFSFTTSGILRVKAGAGITVDADGVNAALPQLDSGSPSGTLSSDDSQTGITISDTPAGDSNVRVTVNGVGVALKGDKTGDAYFSNDAGSTARAIADIASGDELMWNGTSGAYALEATDIVEIFYNA